MEMRVPALRALALLALCSLAVDSFADVIDPYTAPQGPITLGPGEEPTEEEAVVYDDSVLGIFRFASPAVDDDAQAGSTATLEIGGGALQCSMAFPSLGNPDNNAGCVTGYDRGDGPSFDLSGSGRFLIDVESVQGSLSLGVLLIDIDERVSAGLVPDLTAGQQSLPFDQLIALGSFVGADLSKIENLSLTVVNQEGQEGSVAITSFATDGPIANGPVGPNDNIVAEEIPGTYYNADRDGEGCQLTLERDGETFVLTCYFYRDGEQFWVIGVGVLVNGEVAFDELVITSGAQYGNAFDPADVVRQTWGFGRMVWSNCNNAELELNPLLPGYESITLTLTRIVPANCGGGGVQGAEAERMGVYFNLNRDGEGFHLGVEAGEVYIMTWYTYLDGRQVWLIGTGVREGNRIVFDNMVITYGADFGSAFDPADVVRETFGEVIVDITDCNNFTATVNTEREGFHNLVLDMTKIVPGACQ